MRTLDLCLILWCAVSTGFALACLAGYIGSTLAISAGHGDSHAAGLCVLIVAGCVWFTGSVLVYGLMRRIYA